MHLLRWSSILLLCLFLSIATRPAHAATITVDTLTDGIGAAGCSLREAISAANGNANANGCIGLGTYGTDIIELSVSGSYTLTTGSPLSVTSAITIQESAGVTAVIEAATSANTAAYQVFSVGAAGNLTISGITVRHGGTTSTGLTGGCIGSSGVLSLTNGTVIDSCRTSGNGGAIYANQGSIILDDATISNNQAGGAFGGGIFYSSSMVGTSISVTDSFFTNNTAQSGANFAYGGGLYVNVGTALVTGSTFTGNRAQGGLSNNRGGAVFKGSSGILSIDDSILSDNHVSGNNSFGGAIYNDGGSVTVTTSVIQRNTAGTNGDAYSSGGTDSITDSCIVANGDTAVFDTSGGATTATNNWWGSSWGPRVTTAPAGSGSLITTGDSISGNGTSLVNVGLTSSGPGGTQPTGNWKPSAPTIGEVTCLTCASPSSVGSARLCGYDD